ncbi:CotH kinase family protein [Lysinibacillus sp. FSL W8-0992]|uniref:CotH kinase family protein n=1 Tax=Lysinibacillus sp. FSL W8-0992 TaxID=2954643 RepID=UPI0030F60DBF
MIKNRIVYTSMAILLLLFGVMVAVLPNLGIETKNTEYSYETLVFNKSKVTTVDIEIPQEDWEDMLENAADEELKQANITINGKTIENVAIRTKGNLSLRSVVNSDSDRYSLKVDFDYYDDTQSLYGLKKLNLNNNYSDSTLMREYLSYELMEKMGLPTPAHSYMYVTVNGEERGLYLGVEAVDETFLANNYGTNDGFLFKPDGTGSDLKYISDNIADYTGIGLKTNEDNIEDSKLTDMLDAINNGGDIEQYIDVDEMLRYFAVNTALVNLDSYQGNMKHNYYLYENNGVFSIIPWDYNMSFGGFGAGGGGMGGGNPDQMRGNANNELPAEGQTEENADTPAMKQPQEGQPNGEQSQEGQPNGGQPQEGQPNGEQAQEGQPNGGQPQEGQPNGEQAQEGQPNGKQAQEGQSNDEQTQDGQQNANRNKGNFDMGGGMSSNLMADSAINFSITTPVSGTTLEDRPLLNALLSNETYRAKYESYLEQLATTYLTEDYIQSITNNLAMLLTSYEEADPTKFYTTEQFLEGVSGDNSLPEFAKQRSASILKQLSGELVVETSATAQGNMGMPNGDTNNEANGNQMQMPDDFDPSQLPEDFDPSQLPADFDPSQMPEGGMGNEQGGKANGGPMQRPDGMGFPNQGNGQATQETGIDKSTVLTATATFSFLVAALLFVFRFNRRGR